MDWEFIVIFIAFISAGIIIGFPLGSYFGKRDLREKMQPHSIHLAALRSIKKQADDHMAVVSEGCRNDSTDILNAEILEEEHNA